MIFLHHACAPPAASGRAPNTRGDITNGYIPGHLETWALACALDTTNRGHMHKLRWWQQLDYFISFRCALVRRQEFPTFD